LDDWKQIAPIVSLEIAEDSQGGLNVLIHLLALTICLQVIGTRYILPNLQQ